MGIHEYIRGCDLTEADRIEGIADGTLEAWRVAENGEVWYKRSRLPMIYGVPKTSADEIAGDFEQFADDGDEDDEYEEIEVRDSDGTICGSVPGGTMYVDGGTVAFDFGAQT